MITELKLPEGWLLTPISYVAEVKGGKRLPKGKSLLDQVTPYPYIRVTDFENGSINLSNLKYLDAETFEIIKNYTINKEDLYISIAGTIGLVGEIPDTIDGANLTENAAKLCELKGVEKSYLKYVLNSSAAIEQFEDNMTSSGQPKLALFRIKDCTFPLPSLAEQKVIADKLDTLLAQVESTKARLERIPQILKRFRQSVLAAAVSGKLTEEWRGNLEYYQVPQSHDWKWGQVPQLWETDSFPNLVSSRLGKMLDKAKNTGKPTKYIGNINVRWFSFDLENLQKILVSEEEQNELGVKRGDVLICEGGEPGRCAIWSEDTTYPIVFQKALHRVRVGKRITPQWLAFNLKNDSDNKSLEQLFTGTTIKHLTGKALNKYPLRVPPVEEQTEIVRRVEQLFAYADTIEQQVQSALTRVNNLTQSILAKAFRGELTEQWRKDNPDLISGDNSAEALLSRLKAEREAIVLQKKSKVRKV